MHMDKYWLSEKPIWHEKQIKAEKCRIAFFDFEQNKKKFIQCTFMIHECWWQNIMNQNVWMEN